MCASSADQSPDDSEEEDLARKYEALIRRLGEQQLERLETPALETANVVLPPEVGELQAWLADDRVGGKFSDWWHLKIESAKNWRLEIPEVWQALAYLFGQLFPNTSNTFNIFDSRPPVTEKLLFPYLRKNCGLSSKKAKELTLVALSQLLYQALERKDGVTPFKLPSRRKRAPKNVKRDKLIAQMFVDGKSHDDIYERFKTKGISVDNSRQIKSRLKREIKKAIEGGAMDEVLRQMFGFRTNQTREQILSAFDLDDKT